MKFKHPGLELEFRAKLHPFVRILAERFDAFCVGKGYGDAIVTAISRTPKFYEDNALEKPRFSWHLIDCAVDFRNVHLSKERQDACEEWLTRECEGSYWELLLERHGTGPHWHVAYRAWDRRRGFTLTAPPKLSRPPPKE